MTNLHQGDIKPRSNERQAMSCFTSWWMACNAAVIDRSASSRKGLKITSLALARVRAVLQSKIMKSGKTRECWTWTDKFQLATVCVLVSSGLYATTSCIKPVKSVTCIKPVCVNCMNSRSQAPRPVNLVIDAASQKQYNDVFLFLLNLKRAKWSLDDLRFKGKLKRVDYFLVLL